MGKTPGTSRNWDSPPHSLGISLGEALSPEIKEKQIHSKSQEPYQVTCDRGNVPLDDPDLPDFFQDFSDFFWARVLTYSLRFYFGKAF